VRWCDGIATSIMNEAGGWTTLEDNELTAGYSDLNSESQSARRATLHSRVARSVAGQAVQ
jgi:hypothetical protein